MKRSLGVWAVLVWALAGCSDGGSGDDGNAGAPGAAGAAGLGAAGDWGAAGGAAGVSGAAGTAGGASGSGGGVAGAGGTAGCPVLPYWKSLPIIGPWMGVANPGPCTGSVDGTPVTCHYDEQQHLTDCTSASGYAFASLTWQGGAVSAVYGTNLSVTASVLFLDFPNNATTIHLDASGRPTEVTSDFTGDGVADQTTTFVYANCLLESAKSVSIDPSGVSTIVTYSYVYDADGSLIARNASDGRNYTWTYDCW